MTTAILVPALGESIVEASVSKWLKGVGETVALDEPLVELETDKITIEVPSPVAGTLGAIAAEEGAVVAVGAVLGEIAPAAAGAIVLPPPAAPKTEAVAPVAAAPVGAAPSARKLIAEHDLDASAIPGSGKGGRITKSDVQDALTGAVRAVEQPKPAVPVSAPSVSASAQPREQRVRMTRLRQRIAQRLKEAQNSAAILTTFNEVDMSAVTELRARYKDDFEKKYGVRLGFMSFFVKACVAALKEWPAVNSEIAGDEIVYKHYYDIGVAVGTPNGLVVPVVRDADRLSFAALEAAIADYGRKARDGKLTIEEMSGGSFTISNGGVYGSLMSTPILNPPQSAILGMHKTMLRPMVLPDGRIEARPMMYLALSYDHRVIDGREAVSFLVRVKESIESPDRLLLGL
ncbi:MAG: 2-oxoglutarate dehydrogenase complex dihydrolipoyllysine-residue succinyltransferase [Rhodospirillaceae bacterium]|nr:2-oxoglutarate dehydrogenase complex dihydrolipoyllysine-residue succinyltransferase [Rhodospirillaceae bacterium]